MANPQWEQSVLGLSAVLSVRSLSQSSPMLPVDSEMRKFVYIYHHLETTDRSKIMGGTLCVVRFTLTFPGNHYATVKSKFNLIFIKFLSFLLPLPESRKNEVKEM